MSGGAGYNDWETDLSSIIEKTNQNLKLLRRIGDKRTDVGTGSSYDVSTTTSARPATTSSAAQIASEMRSFASSISNRYAAEDAASSSSASRHRHASTTAIPRAASAGPSSSRKLHRSSSVEVDSRARARESLIIRPAAPTTNAFGVATSDGEDESDERSPRVRHASGATRASSSGSGGVLKRSSSLAAKSKSGSSAAAYGSGSTNYTAMPGAPEGGALNDLRKSLEVHIASRSSAFEKALADLKTDMTVVTSDTRSLGMRMQELRDAVTTKLSSAGATTSAVVEHSESIGRLEKHSAVLLGWKVGVDQDLFEISSKVKSFASIQDKVNSLEGHLEALGTAIKAAHRSARHDEKIEELKDRVAMLERQAAHQLDAKAVEHTVQMRVSKETNELENRFNQSLQFLTQKIESKLQSLEKTVQSDRIDAIASVKSELLEDVDKLESRVVKRQELTPIQNAHTQIKDDIGHMQLFFERQDKRCQELKQNSTQIRDELVETRHELTKALHAQQSRVSSTLEEKVGQLTILTKDKNAKAEQKVAVLEKRFKKVEDQCKHLQESVAKVKQDALSRQAADTVSQQRENEQLRQRLLRSIVELEHLQAVKQELERSYETQDRQYQAKLKELRTQIDEQERLKDALRTEMLQAIQSESRQIGIAQGRNALLESLLTREKQESEEKAQQVHKSRQEIAQIRQKMRTLENDVDKKMQKLSLELQTKQAQIDFLTKKLVRSEDEAQKLTESAKREKKLLAKTKELKQQELVATKVKLRELEKVASSVATATKDVEPKSASVVRPREDLSPRLAELEGKRNELQSLLTERVAEVEELKTELHEMKAERDELVKKHKDAMDTEVKRLHAEYGRKIDALEHEILSQDAHLTKLRESLDDKSELDALSDALALAQREKEALLEQLKATESDYERRVLASNSLLRDTHSIEMEKLRAQIEHRVVEIAEAQQTIHDSRERIASLESEMQLTGAAHKHEVSRLATELKDVKVETERLAGDMEHLKAEKADVERKLSEMQTTLESISAGDEELLEEMDNLREQHEQLTGERDRLIEGLRAKADEVGELTQLEAQHRERIAEILQEQKDTSERLEQEIGTMRDTIERERDAATESERQLKLTIEVLQAELDAAKQQATDGVSNASKLETELQTVRQQLVTALQSETDLKRRLDRIMSELAEMGASSTDEEKDASVLLRSHVAALAEQYAQDLAALSSNHAQALKEAAVDHERTHSLGMQINFLSAQILELEGSNAALKSELETHCAEYAKRAQEMGRLQDEMATVCDEKHALEEQVAELSAQVEELDAVLHNQAHEKETELTELKASNAKLSATVGDIRDTMEQLEKGKIAELDGLSSEIQELETALVSLHERPRASAGHAGLMEKEFFSNQQTIASVGQSIRNLYAKLTSGCSVVELQDLRASLVATESTSNKAHEGFQRDQRRLADADHEVLLNVECLDALMNTWSTKESAFASKYVQAAPTLAARLGRLQELFQDALSQCCLPVDTHLAVKDDDSAVEPSSQRPDSDMEHDDDMASEVDVVEEEEEEELEKFDEREQSADLDASRELDGSQDDRLARSYEAQDNEGILEQWSSPTKQSKDADATTEDGSQPSSAERSDRLGLSLDLIHSRAESCTSLIGSPTAAELSTERFQARRAMATTPLDTSRAEASTTLLQSPTAGLLEQQVQSVPAVHALREPLALDHDDDSSVADSCTSLPNSPTGMLLHEPFQPREPCAVAMDDARRESFDESDRVDEGNKHVTEDVAAEHESASSPSPPLNYDRKLDASGDLDHGSETDDDVDTHGRRPRREASATATSMQLSRDNGEMVPPGDERSDIGSGSEQDEVDQEQMHPEDAGTEEDEPGPSHDDSLSQSLESMVRLAAGEESMTALEGPRGPSTDLHEEETHGQHSESGDDLIDDDSEDEHREDGDEDDARAMTSRGDTSRRACDELELDSPGQRVDSASDAFDDDVQEEESRTWTAQDVTVDEANAHRFDAYARDAIANHLTEIPRGKSAHDADHTSKDDEVSVPLSTSILGATSATHGRPLALHDGQNDFDEEEELSELEESLARSVADEDASVDDSVSHSLASAYPSFTVSPHEEGDEPALRPVEQQRQLESHDDMHESESASEFGDEGVDLGQSRELEASHDDGERPTDRARRGDESDRGFGEDGDEGSASEFDQSADFDNSVTDVGDDDYRTSDAQSRDSIDASVFADTAFGGIARGASDGAEDAEPSEDDDEAVQRSTVPVVAASRADLHPPAPVHAQQYEFDDEEELSELEESLAHSTADEETSANPSRTTSLHKEPGEDTSRPVDRQHPSATQDAVADETGDHYGGGDGDDDDSGESVSDFGDASLDLGQSRELEESQDAEPANSHAVHETGPHETSDAEAEARRHEEESDRGFGEDEEESTSEIDQSGDLDSSATDIGDYGRKETSENLIQRPISGEGDDLDAEIDADDLSPQSSLAASRESSPVKPVMTLEPLVNALPSIPSLPLSRLAALRRDSDDDDELQAAQLSMDVQRRRGHNDANDDDEFGEIDDTAHSNHREDALTTREQTLEASCADEEELDRTSRQLDEDAEQTDEEIHGGEESQAVDSVAALQAEQYGSNVEMPTQKSGDQVIRSSDPRGSIPGADDEEEVADDEPCEDQDDSSVRVEIAQGTAGSSLTVHPETTNARDSDPAPRAVNEDHVHEHLRHVDAHDDDDSDFDRVLGTMQDDDDDDETGGLEQSSSFDAEHDGSRPTTDEPAPSPVVADMLARMSYGNDQNEDDEQEEERDDQPSELRFDDDSMDEVERLLLQHAEPSMPAEEAPASGVGRHFTSALRMDDEDEDELIDPDSDGEDDDRDQLQASMEFDPESTRDEDDNNLADSMTSDTGLDHSFESQLVTAKPRDMKVKASRVDDSSSDEDEEEEPKAEALPAKNPTSGFETNPLLSFAPAPRIAALRHFDESEDEDGDDDGREERVAAMPAPQPAPFSSFASIPRAARRNFDDSDEEDGEHEQAAVAPRATPSTAAQVPRAARRDFDESEDDEDGEEEAPRSPPPVSQLAPLSGLGSRARDVGGSSGSLMKALQATRGAMASSGLDDDDMDEVEKLMATSQSLQRKPHATTTTTTTDRPPTTLPSSLTATATDNDFDDDDDETVGLEARKTPDLSVSSVGRSAEGCGLEDNTAALAVDHEEHDELDESLIDDEDEVSEHQCASLDANGDHSAIESRMTPNTFVPSAARVAETHSHDSLAERSAVGLDHEEHDQLDESLINGDDDATSEQGDDGDVSLDDASGTFGLSFGDDVLERALAGPSKPAVEPVKTASSTPAPAAASRPIAQSESEDDGESDDDVSLQQRAPVPAALASSSLLLGQNRKLGALQPLPSLGTTPLPGLGALARSVLRADEDDDDMDEVERLLLEQTSMKKPTQQQRIKSSSLATRRFDAQAEAEDDAFDDGSEHAAPSPLKDANLPRAVYAHDDDEFTHFDGDDDGDDDGEEGALQRRINAELSASGAESQGSAPPSPSRIPILPGSSLLKKPLGSVVTAAASSVRSTPARPRIASAARSEDDGADAYLEDSFDLEESLQEEEEEDV